MSTTSTPRARNRRRSPSSIERTPKRCTLRRIDERVRLARRAGPRSRLAAQHRRRHAVHVARGRSRRRVEVGMGVEPQHEQLCARLAPRGAPRPRSSPSTALWSPPMTIGVRPALHASRRSCGRRAATRRATRRNCAPRAPGGAIERSRPAKARDRRDPPPRSRGRRGRAPGRRRAASPGPSRRRRGPPPLRPARPNRSAPRRRRTLRLHDLHARSRSPGLGRRATLARRAAPTSAKRAQRLELDVVAQHRIDLRLPAPAVEHAVMADARPAGGASSCRAAGPSTGPARRASGRRRRCRPSRPRR